MSISKKSGRKKAKAKAKRNGKIVSSQIGKSNDEKYKALKYLVIAVPIICSLVALGVSIRSCQIADKAFQNSQTFFISENRPFVTLEPFPFQDGSFFRISSEEKQQFIKLQYLMKNVGKQPAKNISFPRTGGIEGLPFAKNAPFSLEIPPHLTLAPGQTFTIVGVINFQWDVSPIENLEAITKEMYKKGFSFETGIEYSSDLEPNKKYRTTIDNKFLRYESILLKSEMI